MNSIKSRHRVRSMQFRPRRLILEENVSQSQNKIANIEDDVLSFTPKRSSNLELLRMIKSRHRVRSSMQFRPRRLIPEENVSRSQNKIANIEDDVLSFTPKRSSNLELLRMIKSRHRVRSMQFRPRRLILEENVSQSQNKIANIEDDVLSFTPKRSSNSKPKIANIEDDVLGFTPKRSSISKPTSVVEDRYLKSSKASTKKASILKSTGKFIDLSDETMNSEDDELEVLRVQPRNIKFGRQRNKTKLFSSHSVMEFGESSNSNKDPSFLCEICTEPKCRNESFGIKDCSHSYCIDCMIKYLATKIQENITNIKCPAPDCKGLLEPEYCRPILPTEVFERWGSALCEAMILGSEKFYCPFKDCSGMLVDDGKEIITQSACPNCWRMFCAQCKVPWHTGIGCAEFQKLNKDEREKEDIMLRKLAQKNKWKRCPSVGSMWKNQKAASS